MPNQKIIKYCGTLGEFIAMTNHMPRNTPIYAATDGNGVTLHVGQPANVSVDAKRQECEVLEACP